MQKIKQLPEMFICDLGEQALDFNYHLKLNGEGCVISSAYESV